MGLPGFYRVLGGVDAAERIEGAGVEDDAVERSIVFLFGLEEGLGYS